MYMEGNHYIVILHALFWYFIPHDFGATMSNDEPIRKKAGTQLHRASNVPQMHMLVEARYCALCIALCR